MESIIFDSLHFILRWLHIITAIAWIGASFYFIWLDNSLESPAEEKTQKGVSGDLWAFHGGGIYEVNKYAFAPPVMPTTLHWFKWEAYSTWITGALLLALFYYYQAELYLVGEQAWSDTPFKAICTSIALLAVGLFVYEILVRSLSRRHPSLFLIFLGIFIVAFSWFANLSFAGRAAFLHVGTMLATIMAANVLVGIMPAQRRFIRAIEQQQLPDADRMAFAKARSVHNNYLTLPVLICMISNHYPLFYGSSHGWWILSVLMLTSAYARHFFNLRHKGIIRPQILIISSAVFIALTIFMVNQQSQQIRAGSHSDTTPLTSKLTQNAELLHMAAVHCQGCHSPTPTNAGFSAAPLGLTFKSIAELTLAKDKIITAVTNSYMPLGNLTKMTESERQEFLQLMRNL